MKTKSLLLLILIAVVCSQHPRTVTAKNAASESSPCVAGRTAAPVGFWTWPSNSLVNIYLRAPDFSEADVAAVRVAAGNWSQSAAENSSLVHFKVHGLTPDMRTRAGDMTLIRGDIYDKKSQQLAVLQAHSLKENELIDYALVVVDFRVKKAEVLTNVMAHELGHSLGLLDCYKCRGQSTAMGSIETGFGSSGMAGPTACDKVAVSAAYRDLLARVGPAAAIARVRKGLLDEGEEPEADDTPVVDRP